MNESARGVAEALWEIAWCDDSDGYMECPGVGRHTRPNGPRDCRIMLGGGKPPTIHCVHSSCGNEVADANFRLRSALGKAEMCAGWRPPSREWSPQADERPAAERPRYDRAKLEGFAGEWADRCDLAWLANRSTRDPARVSSAEFLSALYYREQGERVIVFTQQFSQGEAVWPEDALPDRGTQGVWFLAQPVDGEFRPNPRSAKGGKAPRMSRRSEESVREWRYMVLESDEAPAKLWLAALVQLPLRVAAIYTSGGKSVHCLVRVDSPVKSQWDEEKAALKTGLVTLGADPASLSGVRLTRLPGCWRFGKADKNRRYVRFERPRFQKLLYLAPEAPARPLIEVLPRRDVIARVNDEVRDFVSRVYTAPLDELRRMRRVLWYYTPVYEPFGAWKADLDDVLKRRVAREKGQKGA